MNWGADQGELLGSVINQDDNLHFSLSSQHRLKPSHLPWAPGIFLKKKKKSAWLGGETEAQKNGIKKKNLLWKQSPELLRLGFPQNLGHGKRNWGQWVGNLGTWEGDLGPSGGAMPIPQEGELQAWKIPELQQTPRAGFGFLHSQAFQGNSIRSWSRSGATQPQGLALFWFWKKPEFCFFFPFLGFLFFFFNSFAVAQRANTSVFRSWQEKLGKENRNAAEKSFCGVKKIKFCFFQGFFWEGFFATLQCCI